MAEPRTKPYVYVTWLAKLLAGELQCPFSVWFRAHYQYQKRAERTFDLAKWTVAHDALVYARAAELVADGWSVTREKQNEFRLHGETATLAGKPDLVAQRNGVVLIVDGKSGQQRHSDFFQVLIYLAAWPKLHAGVRPELVKGEIVYKSHVIAVAANELTPMRAAEIWARMRLLGGDVIPAAIPSGSDCRFCDLTVADCPQRVEETVATASAEEF